MDDVRTATAAHLEADETHRLISSEKVDGTAVYDRRGERLGSVLQVVYLIFSSLYRMSRRGHRLAQIA